MSGPVTFRQKPEERLLQADGFELSEDATIDDFLAFAQWVGERGGHVPYMDEFGCLVVSIYSETEREAWGTDRYYAFVRPAAYVIFDPEVQEFSEYVPSVGERYEVVNT